MMKTLKFTAIILLCISLAGNVAAQTCHRKLGKGSTWEMGVFNKKGKLISKNHYEVIELKQGKSGLVYIIESRSFDKKGRAQDTSRYEEKCVGGRMYADPSKMVSALNSTIEKDTQNEEMTMEVEMSDFEFPTPNTKVGTVFEDAYLKMTMKFNESYMPATISKFEYKERTVVGKESKETPAGTFQCLKVSGNLAQNFSFVKIFGKSIEWYAEGLLVYSELYSKSDKLLSYSALTKLDLK